MPSHHSYRHPDHLVKLAPHARLLLVLQVGHSGHFESKNYQNHIGSSLEIHKFLIYGSLLGTQRPFSIQQHQNPIGSSLKISFDKGKSIRDTATIFNPTTIRTALGQVWKFIKLQSIGQVFFIFHAHEKWKHIIKFQKVRNFFLCSAFFIQAPSSPQRIVCGHRIESRINLNIS